MIYETDPNATMDLPKRNPFKCIASQIGHYYDKYFINGVLTFFAATLLFRIFIL